MSHCDLSRWMVGCSWEYSSMKVKHEEPVDVWQISGGLCTDGGCGALFHTGSGSGGATICCLLQYASLFMRKKTEKNNKSFYNFLFLSFTQRSLEYVLCESQKQKETSWTQWTVRPLVGCHPGIVICTISEDSEPESLSTCCLVKLAQQPFIILRTLRRNSLQISSSPPPLH